MRNVLYLLKTADELSDRLLPSPGEPTHQISVVLTQSAVTAPHHHSANRVFVLSEDAELRGVTPAFPAISYQDLLEMIFEADTVVAL